MPLAPPKASAEPGALHPLLAGWLARQGWSPFPFQVEAWEAYARGCSGLVHVPTGAGKTYAAYLGALGELIERAERGEAEGLAILYVTPLRAVSRDIEKALRRPIADLGLPLRVESRTGDTSASLRARQRERLPEVLITTPESLTLLLTRADARHAFASLRAVIVDEWHELLSSKRGTQVELALARLRRLAPDVRTWALSATLHNVESAARSACGVGSTPTIVTASIDRPVVVRSVLPDNVERFPWGGHMGLTMLDALLEVLDPAAPTLIFTNTRSQAERWFAELLTARPEWAEQLALHHGSIDRDVRERVEAGLKSGSIRFVVATSSLDLGVDFSPVERVVQIGSPKGIARLIQRAGRSAHRPGAACEVICVPTHALEMVEIAAARRAIASGRVEERPLLRRPLDALVQHLVTCAFGEGFDPDDLFDEVRTAVAYESLSREEFEWCLELVRHGGTSLRAYPEQHRVAERDGRFVVATPRIAQVHRLNVGTITSDSTVSIRFVRGAQIGSIEEYFVSRLHPGDIFLFAGQLLEFVRLREMTAWVRPAPRATSFTPHWNGSRFPLSTALAASVRELLDELGRRIDARGDTAVARAALRAGEPEIERVMPVLRAQAAMSRIPAANELLVETCRTEEGWHCFLYPFEGRLVHEGLAALLALRLGRRQRASFALAVNDYGIELLSATPYPFADLLDRTIFAREHLTDDLLEAINLGELARRQFREVARVAGLIMQKYPGAEKTTRQLQAGTSLLYDVFEQFEPDNLLLHQARREVLERHCEESRLARTLDRLSGALLSMVSTSQPTPLGAPLVLSRVGHSKLSTETMADRVRRLREGRRR